jgi:HAD superfamily hydrolase (TIGR01509 family)
LDTAVIQAVIFDFDGLILDTESALYASWCGIYAEFGVDLPLSLWSANIGGYSYEAFHPLDQLERLAGRAIDREAVNGRRRTRYLDQVNRQEALPGVREAIAEARRLDLKLGVASSSGRSWVAGHLERLKLLDHFDTLVCGDEVAHVKPDPELYRTALDTLGVPAARCFAVEDSPKGVAAAKGACLYCVAVPNPVTGTLDLGACDRRLESLDAIPFARLVKEIEETVTRAL